jgi:hypothetical protein
MQRDQFTASRGRQLRVRCAARSSGRASAMRNASAGATRNTRKKQEDHERGDALTDGRGVREQRLGKLSLGFCVITRYTWKRLRTASRIF